MRGDLADVDLALAATCCHWQDLYVADSGNQRLRLIFKQVGAALRHSSRAYDASHFMIVLAHQASPDVALNHPNV